MNPGIVIIQFTCSKHLHAVFTLSWPHGPGTAITVSRLFKTVSSTLFTWILFYQGIYWGNKASFFILKPLTQAVEFGSAMTIFSSPWMLLL